MVIWEVIWGDLGVIWDDSQDREKACRILGSLQSWHRRDWKSGILSQGIEGSAPHSLPSEGRDGSEDREKASLQSWHRRDWKSGTLSQGIEGSTPHSLPSEGRVGSEDREKACRVCGSL